MKIVEIFKNEMGSEYEKTLYCILNPEANGGESVSLEADVFRNSDGCAYTDTHLTTHCYSNSVVKLSLFNVDTKTLGEACVQMTHRIKGMGNAPKTR